MESPSHLAWSVCQSVTTVSLSIMAQLIDMPFGLRTRLGPRNHVSLFSVSAFRHHCNAGVSQCVKTLRRSRYTTYFELVNMALLGKHSQYLIIIIIIIDTFIKRHKCLGYRGAGGDVNQADCRNRKVFSWRLKPCSESHSVMFAGRLFQVTGAA